MRRAFGSSGNAIRYTLWCLNTVAIAQLTRYQNLAVRPILFIPLLYSRLLLHGGSITKTSLNQTLYILPFIRKGPDIRRSDAKSSDDVRSKPD